MDSVQPPPLLPPTPSSSPPTTLHITFFVSSVSGRTQSLAKYLERHLTAYLSLPEPLKLSLSLSPISALFEHMSKPQSRNTNAHTHAHTISVILISTTGQGNFNPDTTAPSFQTPMFSATTPPFPTPLNWCLFATGDRGYGADFCAAGRKLYARLSQLTPTAPSFCPIGYGDARTPNGGAMKDLHAWAESHLVPAIKALLPGTVLKPLLALKHTTVETLQLMQREQRTERDLAGQNATSPCPDLPTTLPLSTPLPLPTPLLAFGASLIPSHTPIISPTATSPSPQSLIGAFYTSRTPLRATCGGNTRITPADWYQDTRNITVSVQLPPSHPHPSPPYVAGDVLLVLPRNSPTAVTKLLTLLPKGIVAKLGGADKQFFIHPKQQQETEFETEHRWPSPTSLYDLLLSAADLGYTGVDHDTLLSLSTFVELSHPTGPVWYKKLHDLTTPDGAALYDEYLGRDKRSIVDVLFDAQCIGENEGSNAMTLEDLLAVLKPMRPREYSIASSPMVDSKVGEDNKFDVDLCVAMKKGRSKNGRNWQGGCSRFFNSDLGDEEFLVWLRRGSFVRVLDQEPRPVLCIGAGTGVAPLRGILRERARGKASDERLACKDVLVYGSRKKTADFYYDEEWPTLNHLEVLTAFSQDQAEKIYVTKVIEEAGGGDLIVNHLADKGCLFIAGGAKMASDVVAKIKEMLASRAGGEAVAESYLMKMKQKGLFAVESW